MGLMLPDHREAAGPVINKNHAVTVIDNGREKRKGSGMDEMPETVYKHLQALDQVKKLLVLIKFYATGPRSMY